MCLISMTRHSARELEQTGLISEGGQAFLMFTQRGGSKDLAVLSRNRWTSREGQVLPQHAEERGSGSLASPGTERPARKTPHRAPRSG